MVKFLTAPFTSLIDQGSSHGLRDEEGGRGEGIFGKGEFSLCVHSICFKFWRENIFFYLEQQTLPSCRLLLDGERSPFVVSLYLENRASLPQKTSVAWLPFGPL